MTSSRLGVWVKAEHNLLLSPNTLPGVKKERVNCRLIVFKKVDPYEWALHP